MRLEDDRCRGLEGFQGRDELCTTLSAKIGDANSNNILETTETWTYTCTVNNVTANFTNSADVSGDPPVGLPVTDNATADVTVIAILPPAITKAFGAVSIPLNGITSLSFTITNPNTLTALTGVGVIDQLTPALVVATPNGLSGSCGGGTITAVAGSGTVTLSGATLAAGASCTFSVNVSGLYVSFNSNWIDRVTSTNGGTGNTTTHGGSTTLSDATETAAITVLPVNDRPTASNQPVTTAEDNAVVPAVVEALRRLTDDDAEGDLEVRQAGREALAKLQPKE